MQRNLLHAPAAPASLDQRAGYWLREVSNALHGRFSEELATYRITPPLWAILITLFRGEADTPAALARRLRTDAAGMTRRLDQLENKGLVVRQRNGSDRRSVVLEMTPAGERLVPKLAAISSRLTEEALQGVSKADRGRLLKTLRRMAQNLETEEIDPESDRPVAVGAAR